MSTCEEAKRAGGVDSAVGAGCKKSPGLVCCCGVAQWGLGADMNMAKAGLVSMTGPCCMWNGDLREVPSLEPDERVGACRLPAPKVADVGLG